MNASLLEKRRADMTFYWLTVQHKMSSYLTSKRSIHYTQSGEKILRKTKVHPVQKTVGKYFIAQKSNKRRRKKKKCIENKYNVILMFYWPSKSWDMAKGYELYDTLYDPKNSV